MARCSGQDFGLTSLGRWSALESASRIRAESLKAAKGHRITKALLAARQADVDQLTKLAA